jgi:hypothetical protein
MKKLLVLLCWFPSIICAAQINISANKTILTTNEKVQINLSVDGHLDNEQIGIQGLDNFNIVGQTSSQQIRIINGERSVIQEKIIILQPQKAGEFMITALGRENGEIVKSDEINIYVKKSLIQETKEKLLTDISEKETQSPRLSSLNPEEKLNINELPNMPIVQSVSAFNKIFWLELLGILVLLGFVFRGILWLKKFLKSH